MLFRRYMNQKFDNELILLEQKNKKRRAEINQERVNDRMNRFIPDRNK